MNSKILILGEAWNNDEHDAQSAFVGSLGGLLKSILRQTGIAFDDCYVTSVFKIRPRPTLKVDNLCGKKFEGIQGLPPIKPGKYLKLEYQCELDRLAKEIETFAPNVIIAMGAVAAWATLGTHQINKVRGVTAQGRHGVKVVPTYSCATMRGKWSQRPVMIADVAKALAQSTFPELHTTPRDIWIEPTLTDLDTYYNEFLAPAKEISCDIETAANQITCIGFAADITHALVVPFYDREKPRHCYWEKPSDEIAAMLWVKKVCEMPNVEFIGQNFLYDIKYLWKKYGITVPGFTHDTMLLTHAQQPEMQKGLGFLASVHTDEGSWKFMRTKHSKGE